LVDGDPEDLARRNHKAVISTVIPADVHQPDEAALPAARSRKCAGKIGVVELLVGQPATASTSRLVSPSADLSASHDFK
jgi:hypothetical protein